MTALTDVQLGNLATLAGSDWDRVTAVAIALAETGGHPTTDVEGDIVLETATWGPSVGPWQVRSLKAQKGTGGVRDEDALKDPTHNATSAHSIWADRKSFTPWTTYVSGAYLLYMPRARTAVAGITVNPDGSSDAHSDPIASNPVQAAAMGIGNAVKILAHAGAWVGDSHNMLRVALAVTGGAAVIAGLALVARPAVEQATDAVGKVAAIVPK